MKNLILVCLFSVISLFSYAQSDPVNKKQLSLLIDDIEAHISQNWDQSFESIEEKFSTENVLKNYGIDFNDVFHAYNETRDYNKLVELDHRVQNLFYTFWTGVGSTNERHDYRFSVKKYIDFMVVEKIIADYGLDLELNEHSTELNIELAEALKPDYAASLLHYKNKFEKKVPKNYNFNRSLLGRALGSTTSGLLKGAVIAALTDFVFMGANMIMSIGELAYPYGSSASIPHEIALILGGVSGVYFIVQEFINSKSPTWEKLSKVEQKKLIWQKIEKHQKRYIQKVVEKKYPNFPSYLDRKSANISNLFNPKVKYKIDFMWEHEASTPQEKIDLIKKSHEEIISQLRCEGLYKS